MTAKFCRPATFSFRSFRFSSSDLCRISRFGFPGSNFTGRISRLGSIVRRRLIAARLGFGEELLAIALDVVVAHRPGSGTQVASSAADSGACPAATGGVGRARATACFRLDRAIVVAVTTPSW
jgi:hypothetical protein